MVDGSAGGGDACGGLGVTQLLDELLAEQAVHQAAQLEATEADAADDDAEQGEGAEEDTAGGVMRQEREVARQVAELCGDLDACLASMGAWEEEGRQRREVLKRELEAQYGFTYEEAVEAKTVYDSRQENADESPLGSEAAEEDDNEENRGQVAPYSTSPPPFLACGLLAAPSAIPYAAPFAIAPLGGVDEARLLADEARLARLREEVEELRQQSLQAETARISFEAQAFPPDADLSAWCLEVDKALVAAPLPPSLGAASPGLGLAECEGLEEIEEALASARAHAGRMESDLSVAHARIESELSDLDRLLSECDAIHAKMSVSATTR